MKFGGSLFAAMLLGAAALTAAAAEEAAPATQSGSAASAGQTASGKVDSGKGGGAEDASAKPGATGDQPRGDGGERRAGPKGAETASKGTTDSPGRAVAKHSGTGSAPIDTKIAEPSRSKTAREVGRPGDAKKDKIVIVPSALNGSKRPAKPDNSAVTRNAVGVAISRQAPANRPASAAPAAPPAAAAAPRTAVGLASTGPSAAAGASTGQASAGMSGRPGAAPVNTAMNRSTINGTALRRPSSAPTPVGGPAKNTAIINGSSIRPRH